MSELLPCPFDGRPVQVIGPVLRTDGGEVYIGYCARCGCRGPYAYDQHNAAVLWNRRAAPPAPNVERLVEALVSFVTGLDVRRLDRHAPELAAAYRTARDAAEDAGADLSTHAGFRALVLAALGPAPEPPPSDLVTYAQLQNPD